MKTNEQHVDALKSKNIAVKSIDSKVFDSFTLLTNDEKSERINGAVGLLQHLAKSQKGAGEKVGKERSYSLQRLIRGVGASSLVSRSGFYTTLVAFLSLPIGDDSPSLSDVFEMMEKQLHVGKGATSDKEDSDALIGQILICGAILRSNRIESATDEELLSCVRVLVNAAYQKTLHASMAYTFVIELLEKISAKQFATVMWPEMRKVLKRSWEKHTINTVHFLIEARAKYPTLVDEEYLLATLKSTEILTPQSFKFFSRLFWSSSSATLAITHPAYDSLANFLAKSVSSDALLKFWKKEINEILLAPNKIKEVVTLKILTVIFNTKTISGKDALKLLSDPFIKMINKSLQNLKQQRVEYVVPLYDEFFEAIENYLQSLTDEVDKVNIIKRFVLAPSTLLIEKFTSHRIIHKFIDKLNADGIAELFEVYKGILLKKQPKDPKDQKNSWSLVERQHSIQMLQTLLGHKAAHGAQEWRTEQLKFLLRFSLFYIGADDRIVIQKEDTGLISKDLAQHLKRAFFTSLQLRLPRLDDDKSSLKSLVDVQNGLVQLVDYCSSLIPKKAPKNYLREPLTDEALASWKNVISGVAAVEKKTKSTQLRAVFNVLLIHMGFQLFREAEMAQTAIADLENCIERTQKKQKAKAQSDEPEWIEVVVDLFLHLLSQNTSFLRNLVDSLFPLLCKNLNLTAVHQILSILDMKDGKNPLTPSGEVEDEDDDDDEEMESENEDSNDDEDDEEEGDNDESEVDDEEEDDEEDAEEDDEGTVADQLRSVISSALGAAAPETDTESIDLNDMDDAEAERLDQALSVAFQSFHKKNGQNSKKKSRRERTTNTTVMHFRICVLDLIEICLKNKPSLVVTLEILLALFSMTEQCAKNKDLVPLANRLNRVLKTLFGLRKFENVDDVTEENVVELLSSLVDKKAVLSTIEEHDKLLSKCITFLIGASEALTGKTLTAKSPLFKLVEKHLLEFVRSRNPTLPYSCFQDLMKIRWQGAWLLGQSLVKNALLPKDGAKSGRRSQALEFLTLIYKNHGFITQQLSDFNKVNGTLEKNLEQYIKGLKTTENVPPKELSALLVLLLDILKCKQKIKGFKSNFTWKVIGDCIQDIRKRTSILSYPTYAEFCKKLEIVPIKQTEVEGTTKKPKQNGQQNGEPQTNGKLKRKHDEDTKKVSKKDAKKLKKQKNAERLKLASAGFEGGFGNIVVDSDVDVEEAASDSDSE